MVAAAFRPALRTLGPVLRHSRLSGQAAPQAVVSPHVSPAWEGAQAGPSRLFYEATTAHTSRQNEDKRPLDGAGTSGDSAHNRTSRKRLRIGHSCCAEGVVGKGKARLLDEATPNHPFWLKAGHAQTLPVPTDYPGQPLLFVPSRSELLRAAEANARLFDAWTLAFDQVNFVEALDTLESLLGTAELHRTPLQRLLLLRLLDLVHTVKDVERALDLISASDLPLAQHAHALSILLERGFRDLQAAHLARALVKHLIHLAHAIDAQHLPRNVAFPRLSAQKMDSRWSTSRQRRARQRGRLARQQQALRIVEDLLLRSATLLPHFYYVDAWRSAFSILDLVASRCRLPGNLVRVEESSSEQRWQMPRHLLFLLRKSARRRPRKGCSFPSHTYAFLARIARTLLGSTSFPRRPGSSRALDTSVLVPPPLTSRLFKTYDSRQRLKSNHLRASQQWQWLDFDLAKACVGLLDFLRQGRWARVFGGASAFDLECLLHSAIRSPGAPLAAEALDQVVTMRQRSDPVYTTTSCDPFRPPHQFFAQKRGRFLIPSPQHDHPKHKAHQGYQLFLTLHKLNGVLSHASTRADSARAAPQFEEIVKALLKQALDRDRAPETFEPQSSRVGEDLLPFTASFGDGTERHWAAFKSASRGIEYLAQSLDTDVRQVLACFNLDHRGQDTVMAPFMRARRGSRRLAEDPYAYISAMKGLSMRGAHEASDVLFQAFLRRVSVGRSAYPYLKLTAGLLSMRWECVVLAAAKMLSSNYPHLRISRFVQERAAQIGQLIGADFFPAAPGESTITMPALTPSQSKRLRVEPDANLLTHLVMGLSSWHHDAYAAVQLFFDLKRTWPQHCSSYFVLNSLLVAAQRLAPLPLTTDLQPLELLDQCLSVVRETLFAQHPEVRYEQAPIWRPTQPDSDVRPCTKRLRRTPPKSTDLPFVNFSPDLLQNFIGLWAQKLHRMLGMSRAPLHRDLLDEVTELVTVLAWMRALGLQPKEHALGVVLALIGQVYRAEGWLWESPNHSDEPATTVTVNSYSGKRVVVQMANLRRAFGPLAGWLAEWLEVDPSGIERIGRRGTHLQVLMSTGRFKPSPYRMNAQRHGG